MGKVKISIIFILSGILVHMAYAQDIPKIPSKYILKNKTIYKKG